MVKELLGQVADEQRDERGDDGRPPAPNVTAPNTAIAVIGAKFGGCGSRRVRAAARTNTESASVRIDISPVGQAPPDFLEESGGA